MKQSVNVSRGLSHNEGVTRLIFVTLQAPQTLVSATIPLQGNFGNCRQWRSLNLFGFTAYRETRATRAATKSHIWIL